MAQRYMIELITKMGQISLTYLLNTLPNTDSVLSDLRNEIGKTNPDSTKNTWTQNWPSLKSSKIGMSLMYDSKGDSWVISSYMLLEKWQSITQIAPMPLMPSRNL